MNASPDYGSGYPAPMALQTFVSREGSPKLFLDRGNNAWHYRDSAGTGPTLVLLPGALGNADVAWLVYEEFFRAYRVLLVTYPSGLTAAELAAGLRELLDSRAVGAVGAVGALAIWASSYGAWWSQAFAAGDRTVAGLWLGNTFVDGNDVAASPLFNPEWLANTSTSDVVARWSQALTARPDDCLRAVQLHMLHKGLDPAAFHARLRQVASAPVLQPADGVRHTVIANCADDGIITPAVCARVIARYPDATNLSFPNGGHYPHIVCAERLFPHMRAWLRLAFSTL